MPDAVNATRQLSGTPTVTVYHGKPFEDEVMRRWICESKTNSNDWNRGSADDTECELPRGIILARELTSAGRATYKGRAEILLANGETGDLLLKVYTYSVASGDPDPAIALGSATLALTHTVSMANPGASSGLGFLHWDFELNSLGSGDMTNLQTWYSRARYKRHTSDTLQLSEDAGKLTLNLHRDTIVIFTAQKSGGWTGAGTGRVNFYSHDGFIEMGQSGQA